MQMDLEGKGGISRFSEDFAEMGRSQLVNLRKDRSWQINTLGEGSPLARDTAYVRAQRPSLALPPNGKSLF